MTTLNKIIQKTTPTRIYIGDRLKLEGLTVAGYTGSIGTKNTPVMMNPVYLNQDGKQVVLDRQISSRCYQAFIMDTPELYTPLTNREAIEGHALLFVGIARKEHSDAIASLNLDGEDVFTQMTTGVANPGTDTRWTSLGRGVWVTYASEPHIDWMLNELRRAARAEIRTAQKAKDEERLKQAGQWLLRADVEGVDRDLVAVCMPNPTLFLKSIGITDTARVKRMIESGKWKRSRSSIA